jgi:hypothetical protein
MSDDTELRIRGLELGMVRIEERLRGLSRIVGWGMTVLGALIVAAVGIMLQTGGAK